MNKEQSIIAGRYELSRQIGEGGMGKVYLAKHIELGQEVAIKCLRPESQSSANGADRFYLEAKTYAAINHPNLVKLHDFERTEKGELRMVLEYVRGQTLGAFLKMYGALHPLLAIDIAIQVAQGLSAAHHDNILHRDLKPENIMLSPLTREKRNYHVKILDFGIAKQLDKSRPNLTALGMVCGTPDYMSPEQACGLELDKSSDIYSLGVVFYEMLTGHPPYKGDKRQVMSAHCTEPIPLISDRSPYPIPSDLEDVLQRCLAKNTCDRYQSLEELIAALDQVNLKNFEQKVPSYFLGKPKSKEQQKGLSSDRKDSEMAQAVHPDVSDANKSSHLHHSGLRALPMKSWFHNIYKSLNEAIQEKNGQQNILLLGILFVLIIMITVSMSLNSRQYQPQSQTKYADINNPANNVIKPKLGNMLTVVEKSDTQSQNEQDEMSNTPSVVDHHPIDHVTVSKQAINMDKIRAKQAKIAKMQNVLREADRAYWQNELTQANRLIAEFKNENEAKPLYNKIKALQSFQARVKKAKCKQRGRLFKRAPSIIVDHPFVLDGAEPCRTKSGPPLRME